jgi:hypothetical protein
MTLVSPFDHGVLALTALDARGAGFVRDSANAGRRLLAIIVPVSFAAVLLSACARCALGSGDPLVQMRPRRMTRRGRGPPRPRKP